MSDLNELLKNLFDEKEPDYSKWDEIKILEGEAVEKMKAMEADSKKDAARCLALHDQIDLIKTESKLRGKRWWEYLHSLGIPRGENLHIEPRDDKLIILKEPKKN